MSQECCSLCSFSFEDSEKKVSAYFYHKVLVLLLRAVLKKAHTLKIAYTKANFRPITKTCLYNFDPLKPHFYIVKLGFTGVYIIFLNSAQKHRLWVRVRTASSRRF